MSKNYDHLAARLTDPAQPARGKDTLTGDAAAEQGRAFLVREYGSAEAVEAAQVARGRRRVGQPAGPSPTVRARIGQDEYAAMKQLEATTGRTQSELVREAIHQLLLHHKLLASSPD